jgi:hypothetical protein
MQLETLISISFGAWLASATETERATVCPLARGEAAIPS